jgi:hypothetical protein
MKESAVTSPKALHDIEQLVAQFGCSKDHKHFRYAVLVMAALAVGARVDMLAEVTGYPIDLVSMVAVTMETAGLWHDGSSTKLDEVVDDVEFWPTFVAYVGVATGELTPVGWRGGEPVLSRCQVN